MSRQRWHMLIISLLLCLGTIGCVEMPDTAQTLRSKAAGQIYGTRTVGQTFVASHDGLSRIDVQLATYGRHNTQSVVFHLRSTPYASTDIATVAFEAGGVEDNAYRSFRFASIPDSEGRSFYFFFGSPTSRPGDAITIWYSPDDVRGDGQMYLQGEPQSGDLAFKAYHTYGLAAIFRDLRLDVWNRCWVLIRAALLYILPGYALIMVTGFASRQDFAKRLVLAPPLSAALVSLTVYAARPLGVHLESRWAWGWLALFACLIGWRYRTELARSQQTSRELSWPDPVHVVLIALTGLMVAVRMLAVQGLAVPLWGDSYHHTMISQLMVDHGGLFNSWQPYAPLTTFTYHFGFHANVAFLHWLTGLDVIRSVLWTGQLLNALAVLGLYPLAVRISDGNRWAGVFTVLIGGFLSPMPMYYVNWGRYTQLAGQVILPVAILSSWDVLEQGEHSHSTLIVALTSVVGLALTHYRVLVMYGCFLFVLLLTRLWQLRRDPSRIRDLTVRVGLLGLGSCLVVLPWTWHSLRGLLPGWLVNMVHHGTKSTLIREEYNVLGRLLDFHGLAVSTAGVLGGLWGLLKRLRRVLLVLSWFALLLLAANPYIVGLPGAGVLTNFTLLLAIYIPLSLLGGCLAGQITEWLSKKRAWSVYPIASIVVFLALWGGRDRVQTVDEERFALVTEADMQAMAWIRDNTAPQARFLVNSFLAYGGVVTVGSDAGWWIPLLAMRSNTVPPITAYLEAGEEPSYAAAVTEFGRHMQGADMDSPTALALLEKQRVSHIFIGKKQGRVNYPGDTVLDPGFLSESPHYRSVYHQDGVWVFEVVSVGGGE